MSNSEVEPRTAETVVHFAPTAKRKELMNVMCGYVAPDDDITTNPLECTCGDCKDWLRPPEDDPQEAV